MVDHTKKWDDWIIISILVLVSYALFLVYSLISLLQQSVFVDGKFTFEYFEQFFSKTIMLKRFGIPLKFRLVLPSLH